MQSNFRTLSFYNIHVIKGSKTLCLFTSSVDPVTAIRQQFQLLVQMGRGQDIAQLSQEIQRAAQGNLPSMKFTEEGKKK